MFREIARFCRPKARIANPQILYRAEGGAQRPGYRPTRVLFTRDGSEQFGSGTQAYGQI